MSNSTTLSDSELALLAAELQQGKPNQESTPPYAKSAGSLAYSANDQEACDQLNAKDRSHEVEVEMDSVSADAATLANRPSQGLSGYLTQNRLNSKILARCNDNSDANAQDSAISLKGWLEDVVDRNILASSAEAQQIMADLLRAEDISQADVDWFNAWGQRTTTSTHKTQRTRMHELGLPTPCRVHWVIEARKLPAQAAKEGDR